VAPAYPELLSDWSSVQDWHVAAPASMGKHFLIAGKQHKAIAPGRRLRRALVMIAKRAQTFLSFL